MTVATIPATCSFLEQLARLWLEKQGAWSGAEDSGLAERGLILVPGRRAGRALMEAFLRVLDGKAALLPDIVAIGDVGESDLFSLSLEAEIPPPVETNRRLAVLAQLIFHAPFFQSLRGTISLERVWPLAQTLAELMDEAERCGVDLKEALPGAVEEEFAHHWEQTLIFLQIVTDFWPKWLEEQGLSNPVAQHRALLKAHVQLWREEPPSMIIWAAGFSDGSGEVAAFLETVAGLPAGAVVLQAVDLELEQPLWESLPESHPQFAFRDLLDHMGVSRTDIETWGESRHSGREALMRDVMLPEEGLPNWTKIRDCSALSELSLLAAPDVQQEAGAIALILRDVVSEPGRSGALITPDRDLSRRVKASLLRYGIYADTSAGVPLNQTSVAVFLRLIASAAASEYAPVPFLGVLKHPFALSGLKPGECRSLARLLELHVLRGVAPGSGFSGLYAALDERVPAEMEATNDGLPSLRERLYSFLERLENAFSPLLALSGFQSMPVWLEALVRCAENLACSDAEGAETSSSLWQGDDGIMLSHHLAELMIWTEDLPREGLDGVEGFLNVSMRDLLLQGYQGGTEPAHPRISILGVLEARLLSFDTVILGGLSEANWPPAADPGPWLSRPMRKKIGLSSPEMIIGQSAHDFVTATLASQKVIFSHARREGGRPTVISRWLARFDAFLAGQTVLSGEKKQLQPHPALGWQHHIDSPLGDACPVLPPQPRPPVALRPKRFSITDIDMLVKDPYGLYAKRILHLKAIKPLEEEADQLIFGFVVHKAMEDMMRQYPSEWPQDALQKLTCFFEKALGKVSIRASLKAWWMPRLKNIAAWVCEQEMGMREGTTPFHSYTEIKADWRGRLSSGREFQLVGRADRIDLMEADEGGLKSACIFDYKTGTLPNKKEVINEWSAQLVLESALLTQGAFKGLPEACVKELVYWKLSGGMRSERVLRIPGSEVKPGVLLRVRGLLEDYEEPGRPYLSKPRINHVLRYSDYEQLARVGEWYNSGEGGQ